MLVIATEVLEIFKFEIQLLPHGLECAQDYGHAVIARTWCAHD